MIFHSYICKRLPEAKIVFTVDMLTFASRIPHLCPLCPRVEGGGSRFQSPRNTIQEVNPSHGISRLSGTGH